MKEIGIVSWKLPPREMSCQHFCKFSPSENNYVYSIFNFLWNESWKSISTITVEPHAPSLSKPSQQRGLHTPSPQTRVDQGGRVAPHPGVTRPNTMANPAQHVGHTTVPNRNAALPPGAQQGRQPLMQHGGVNGSGI